MTGCFELYIDGKHVKDFEQLGEITSDLVKWFYRDAKHDSEIKIRCELPT